MLAEISSNLQPWVSAKRWYMRSRSPREQGRFVAAGAGADFEHRRAIVGGVARQQLDRERALGVRKLVPDFVGFRRRPFP